MFYLAESNTRLPNGDSFLSVRARGNVGSGGALPCGTDLVHGTKTLPPHRHDSCGVVDVHLVALPQGPSLPPNVSKSTLPLRQDVVEFLCGVESWNRLQQRPMVEASAFMICCSQYSNLDEVKHAIREKLME